MEAVACEYDGAILTRTAEGLEPACTVCDEDIMSHRAQCWPCGFAGEAPDRKAVDLSEL